MQDEATPHRTKEVFDAIYNVYMEIEWSAEMPDCRGVGESRVYLKRAKKVPRRDLSRSLASLVIGLGYPKFAHGGIEWSPYSPDLNPCDFFLWGYIKYH